MLHLDGYRVRRFEESDSAAMQAMFEADPHYFEMIDGRAASPSEARSFATELPDGKTLDDKFVYVVEDGDGKLAAAIDLIRNYPEPGIWFLGLIFVAPDGRSSGLGTRLIAALLAQVREGGGGSLRLACAAANVRAMALYRRLGFGFLYERVVERDAGFHLTLQVLERTV